MAGGEHRDETNSSTSTPTRDPIDDAWFPPPREGPRPPPRGVVYQASTPARPPTDPYHELRQMNDGDELWPLEDPRVPVAAPPRSGFTPFLVGLALGLTLAVVSIVGFQLFRRDAEQVPSTPVAGAVETTVAAETTLPVETVPEPAPTTVPTTIPEQVEATVPAIESFGTPLDIADLRLAADAIGVLSFGTEALPALGRLVASLGAPDDDTGDVVSAGELGTCVGDTIRVVRWGPLQVITADGVLAAFRLDSTLGGLDTRAATISTLSGLRAGDTVEDLETIYGGDFTISLLEDDGAGTVFELRRSSEADLLLWGPISSIEPDGTVLGIYSPEACSG